jgi:hypothetical protein
VWLRVLRGVISDQVTVCGVGHGDWFVERRIADRGECGRVLCVVAEVHDRLVVEVGHDKATTVFRVTTFEELPTIFGLTTVVLI